MNKIDNKIQVLLYGASGHSKVISSILESMNINVHGVFDDNLSLTNSNNLNILGVYDPNYKLNFPLIISVGDNWARKRISEIVYHKFALAIHNSVIIDKYVKLGSGTVLMHNAILQRDVVVGKHCIINTNASVDHDCVLGDFVHIAPSATLTGNIKVDEGTLIGANATILPNINIGRWCVIGAGAVVTEDIPDHSLVVGVPGKILKKINYD
jgi:sugar O-acyltransferase (sialic acid O-acetyltransferase NeuD family)